MKTMAFAVAGALALIACSGWFTAAHVADVVEDVASEVECIDANYGQTPIAIVAACNIQGDAGVETVARIMALLARPHRMKDAGRD